MDGSFHRLRKNASPRRSARDLSLSITCSSAFAWHRPTVRSIHRSSSHVCESGVDGSFPAHVTRALSFVHHVLRHVRARRVGPIGFVPGKSSDSKNPGNAPGPTLEERLIQDRGKGSVRRPRGREGAAVARLRGRGSDRSVVRRSADGASAGGRARRLIRRTRASFDRTRRDPGEASHLGRLVLRFTFCSTWIPIRLHPRFGDGAGNPLPNRDLCDAPSHPSSRSRSISKKVSNRGSYPVHEWVGSDDDRQKKTSARARSCATKGTKTPCEEWCWRSIGAWKGRRRRSGDGRARDGSERKKKRKPNRQGWTRSRRTTWRRKHASRRCVP